MFAPSGRDIILGHKTMHNNTFISLEEDISSSLKNNIFRSNIVAICTTPNTFNFDIIDNATSNEDYLKANQCSPVDFSSTKAPTGPGYTIPGFLWFMVVTVIIFLLAWAIYQIWPADGATSKEKEKPEYQNDYGGGNNPEVANHNGGDHSMWKYD